MKRFFGLTALLVSACLLSAAPLQAKPDKDLQARIDIARKLMTSDGLGKTQDQMIAMLGRQITSLLLTKNPGKDEEIKQLMGEAIARMSDRKGEMNDKVASLYAEHFSLEEMRELLAFKQSPLGRKMDRKMPLIMREAMSAGQQWGRRIAEDIMKNLQAKAQERGLKL